MSRSSLFGSDDELDEDGEDNITFHAAKEAPNDASQSSNSNATTVPEWGFNTQVAKLTPPDIAGFYLFRDLVSLETQESLLHRILEEKAVTAKHPQAMLFPRSSQSGKDIQDCPSFLSDFVEILPQLLRPHLPLEDLNAVFEESLPLQTIINLYEPGQGITPHVDLPHRYANPIIGISLASATVMDFVSLDGKEKHAILIRPGDVYVLLHTARYDYKHGIAYRNVDFWRDEDGEIRKLYRGIRVSITFRRMLSKTSELSVDA